jgi:hypothetical protein
MNATITVNIDDEAQTEYDEDFDDLLTLEDVVRKVRRLIREEDADGRTVSSMVIVLTF